MTPIAVLEGVGKRYSPWGRWVLRTIDLTIEAGTATTIVGANGSGKSTLLRIVAGASAPTRGAVRRHARGSTALVPERLAATLRWSAAAYVAHMGRLRGVPDDLARRRAGELFDRLALSPGTDVPVASLSKGNSQKVALVQALLAPVELLVLDEPFNGLDEDAVRVLSGLLAQAREEGAAVVLSSHGTAPVAPPDRILTLTQGVLT